MNTITWLWWLNSWIVGDEGKHFSHLSLMIYALLDHYKETFICLDGWTRPTPVSHPPSWAKCPAQLNGVPTTWLSSSFSLMKWVVPPQFLIKCNQRMNDFGKLEWSVCQGALWANSPGKRVENKGWKYSSILITGGFLL